MKPLLLILAAVGVTSTAAVGADLWMRSQPLHTGAAEHAYVEHAYLQGNGTVTFHMQSSAAAEITIIRVGVTSGNTTEYTSVSSSNVLPVGGSLDLTVTFGGVVWHPGTHYAFLLISAQGDQFPYSVTA